MKYLINHKLNAALIIAIILTMTACSVKSLYNQLDNIIPYYVEGMVSLDSMLEEKVQKRTLVLISWHRNTQLKQYADWLRVLQRDVNEQLTEEKIQQYIIILDDFWKSISYKVDEEMALLLPQLNSEQRKELFSNIDDKNTVFREEFVEVDNEERITQYTDRIFDSYETWLGNLTDEQDMYVKQAATKLQSTTKFRLERRQQWQRAIKDIIDTNNSKYQKAAYLRQYFTDYNQQKNTVMKRIEKKNKTIFAGLTLQIARSLTNEQKAHFMMTTKDYIRMFDELASER